MTKKIQAYHFCAGDKYPVTRCGQRVEPGIVMRITPPLNLCCHGLHGSRRVIDALGYAPGYWLCRTEHWGAIIEGDDKICSSVREVIWVLNADWYLHEFACRAAEYAMERSGIEPDPRLLAAIKCKRDWLAGYADNADLDAARGAAYAAWDTACDAAWGAAYAAWGAARNDLNTILMDVVAEADYV